VSYDAECQRICSTSDDRSVRLWSVDFELCDGSNRVTQWKEAKITLLHTMYGHTARVWRNIITDNVIISVGEVGICVEIDRKHTCRLQKDKRKVVPVFNYAPCQ
jgi:hypothetical protein